ncbi:aminotransferase class III-fold pyridoxal phosphate-dependent enzyme [Schleiferiaceae bacterium]|nr:aminotransferase class III-fold pyridoxal phosphate-dependent enzyme [Schleiferiaceae bacterium]
MKGQDLYRRAKQIIPGGNHLLSKRPEMFLPERWPSYFSKSKGCQVWDLDGNQFFDFSTMSVGTSSLGYANDTIDDAVIAGIKSGNMSTLNSPEEVYLAEKLLELNPWADMVRFARTGGEANAISIRIARAAAGRDKVAICGYHGWHDWYLAANINDNEELRDHLLPGLNANGVPKGLRGTVIPFTYNDLESLRRVINENPDLGVVKMEVVRSFEADREFLKGVRALCDANNIVLIFDECTSGFRETFGGYHSNFGVSPDLCMYGKALGNGYAITAVVGRREVMESAQSTFISSTFWTERIGFVAGLATLREMEEIKSWEIISRNGKKVKEGWQNIANSNDLRVTISGLDALATFSFDGMHLERKTFLTQEMLSRGYLAANVFYPSISHHDEVINNYLEALHEVFYLMSKLDDDELIEHIKGPICHSGFKRIN